MTRRNLLLGLSLAAFLLVLLRTAWVGDDVYITLRTVDNFVNGYGLRWNVAERVQSFTHPLWMFLFVTVYAPTRDAYFTALTVSIAASLLTFWLVTRRDGFAWLGAVILLFSKAFVDYSASGLENPLTHLLLVLFFIAFIEKPVLSFSSHAPRISAHPQPSGCNPVCYSFTHLPPLVLVIARRVLPTKQSPPWRGDCFARILRLREYPPSGSRLAMTMRDSFLGFLPLLLWEAFSLFYYGFPFPNTYYAKLGAGIPQNELFAQGFVYLLDSLQRDPLTLIVIAAGIVLALWRGQTRERLLALGSLLYLAYVLSIGGDFMSGRFLTASLLVSALLLMRLLANLAPTWKYAISRCGCDSRSLRHASHLHH